VPLSDFRVIFCDNGSMKDDLLEASLPNGGLIPLADVLQPCAVDDVIGHQYCIGEAKPMRVAFASGSPNSTMLWDSMGVEKSTLVRLTAHASDAQCIALSGVLSGIKDIRSSLEPAQQCQDHGKFILACVDEVHHVSEAVRSDINRGMSALIALILTTLVSQGAKHA
jgi:putative ATPase